MKKILITLSTVALATLPLASAQAVNGYDYGVYVYMSAPKVQGTPLTANFTTENFDGFNSGDNPTVLSIGNVTGSMRIDNGGDYGGASSTSPDPVTGGVSSKYATTVDNVQTITIDLTKPAKYLGLWWSAGSPSNQVKFFSGGEEVAVMTTAGLIQKLTNATVGSLDGNNTYNSSDYYGNPVNKGAGGEPFVYLNVYGMSGVSFDRIELSGGGFEFDNITVSDLEQTPANSLVDVEFIPSLIEPPVDPDDEPKDTDEPLADTGYDAFTVSSIAAVLLLLGSLTLGASRVLNRRN
ncbi:MAG: hypothetical protein ACKOFA_05640 [Rhodoluna sp.]